MRLLFTIAGRAGSKGIRNKNVRGFCGRPLPFYTLAAIDLLLGRHRDIDGDIVLSSDSDALLGMFEGNPIREVSRIRRTPDLAGDAVSKFLVIRDCLVRTEERTGVSYDAVVDLDITAPLRTVDDVRRLIEAFAGGSYDAVFSVAASRRNPWFNMVMRSEDGGYRRVIASEYTARQQAPETFDMNASMYAYRPDFLRSAGGIFDGRCGIVEMPDTGILDLDRESDFDMMEAIAAHLYGADPRYAEIRDRIPAEGAR